mmetsp:Transcript_2091/g.3690  ORF Transcript_2091/g.3690 Transcript_2091/m.3690 type:complete len:170 (-) Transcript_2091:107-616(-)
MAPKKNELKKGTARQPVIEINAPASGESAAVKQAKLAAAVAKKGNVVKRARKVRYDVKFRMPKTLRLPKRPLYPRRSILRDNSFDEYKIIRAPVTTETAMKKIEENNTLVFLVDLAATKFQIKKAVERLYDVKVQKVNTLVRPDAKKKAFVRLTSDYEGIEVANKIGII